MKHIIIKFFILSVVLILSGCSTKVSSIKKDTDLPLKQGEGYLLLAVETNVQLRTISILGEKNILLTEDDLQKGSNYILVDMPAGHYQIDRITKSLWSGFTYVDLEEEYWSFEIKPNVVSYIGHLNVQSNRWMSWGYFELNNKSSYALEFMEESFPNILNKRTLSYQGPGQDDFLNFVNTQVNGETE